MVDRGSIPLTQLPVCYTPCLFHNVLVFDRLTVVVVITVLRFFLCHYKFDTTPYR